MGAVNVADIIVRSNFPCVACFAPCGATELSASGSESNAGDAGMELSDSDTGSSIEVGAGNATGVHEDMSLSDSGESHAEMMGDAMSDSGEARLGGARRICRQPLRPGLRDLWERFGVKALPRIGCLSSGKGLEKRRMPQFVQVEPLGILLRQADSAASLHGRRNAELVPHGEEPVLQVYGTLRCFRATHRAAKVLTVRNKRELPECLFFDPHFRKEYPTAQSDGLCYVTATFGEWLQGLPQGWTALQLVQQAHLEVNRAGLAGTPRVSAGPPEPFVAPMKRRLTLFTGCGALDYALPWCSPVAYCERDPDAAAVLRARMLDGSLPKAPLYDDVQTLTEKAFTTQIDTIVAGFPCIDLSKAGRKRGLKGSESSLVWEVIRLARVLDVPMLFLENVDNFRFLGEFWEAVLVALMNLDFQIEWVSLCGTHAGSPQRRRRVFLLARRGKALSTPFAPPFAQGLSGVFADPQSAFIGQHKGLQFNSGRPSTK